MAFTEIDEKALVRAYQAGNERAFDTIVRTQYNALYAHALRRLSQHEAAEDAVQDTLLRAYRALPNLDGDLALRAWLHRILTNVCHDEGNRRRRAQGLVDKVSALPEELVGDPAEEAVLFDTVRIMSEALDELPESYREALVLRYVDGLSFREVAEVTGVTEENARARVHRGRGALSKIMSRLALIAAFIIPGLRRTQTASSSTASTAADAGVGDHAVNLTTQLTSHVMTSAPAMSRFAEAASSLPSGTKSAIAAAAVTAVAAVSVPVAVHTVREAQRPNRPAPAVAAPAPGSEKDGGLTSAGTDPDSAATTSTTATETTSTTLPLSQTHPFEALAGTPDDSTSSTTTPPRKSNTTSTTVAPAQGSVVKGEVTTTDLSESGESPQWDIEGALTLTVGDKVRTGTITGRIYVYDDGTASADQLTLVVEAHTLQLRFRGDVVDIQNSDGTTTYQILGSYLLTGAADVGLADRGDVTSSFGVGNSPSLVLRLSGRSSS
jgi:RNA polymerase sigma-70 factor, ECF subfamily